MRREILAKRKKPEPISHPSPGYLMKSVIHPKFIARRTVRMSLSYYSTQSWTHSLASGSKGDSCQELVKKSDPVSSLGPPKPLEAVSSAGLPKIADPVSKTGALRMLEPVSPLGPLGTAEPVSSAGLPRIPGLVSWGRPPKIPVPVSPAGFPETPDPVS